MHLILLALLLDGSIHEVTYPASDREGELTYPVSYRLWIPDGVKTIRGVIVHQHGCGLGARKGGETAADDLHWQALARKWDCALLGPSYKQNDGDNCRLWCDPRNGSETTFLRSLTDLAMKTAHPELETAPWCLWGHSGGGFWASIMQTRHPKRTLAVWLRSGTAYTRWESGAIPRIEITDEVYQVPVVCNPGFKEKEHKRFKGAWTGAYAMFEAYRAQGAPITVAPDPRTGHECGDSRYLAIPFFDACLRLRLPESGTELRPLDPKAGWRAEPLSTTAVPAADFKGDEKKSLWFPDAKVANAWMEYVKTGATSDDTPPPAATGLKAEKRDGSIRLTWSARADFESGIRAFIVLRNGKRIGQVPEKPIGRFGRPLYQSMSFHDTPQRPLPEMTFTDASPEDGARYQIVVINGVELKSKPSEAASVR